MDHQWRRVVKHQTSSCSPKAVNRTFSKTSCPKVTTNTLMVVTHPLPSVRRPTSQNCQATTWVKHKQVSQPLTISRWNWNKANTLCRCAERTREFYRMVARVIRQRSRVRARSSDSRVRREGALTHLEAWGRVRRHSTPSNSRCRRPRLKRNQQVDSWLWSHLTQWWEM